MRLLWLEVKWPPVPWVLAHRYNLAKLIVDHTLWWILSCFWLMSPQAFEEYPSNEASGVKFCIIPEHIYNCNYNLLITVELLVIHQHFWYIVYHISILTVVIYALKPPDYELKFNVIWVCFVLAECCKKREMFSQFPGKKTYIVVTILLLVCHPFGPTVKN